jgi:hypothetical protein
VKKRERGPVEAPPEVSHRQAADQVKDTARARRAAAMRANAAAFAHLHAYGLTSEVVVAALQQCQREAA